MLFKYQLPALIWAFIILILTLTPGEHLPSLQIGEIMIDKLLHFGVFLVLSFLAFVGEGTKRWPRLLIYCTIYGVIVEGMQYWVPGRNIDWFDLIANVLGCLGGIVLYKGYQKVAGSMAKK